MYSNIKSYLLHIQMLEVINIILYTAIVIISTIVTLFITKNNFYALIAMLISVLIGYIIYSIIQLKADYYKMQIDTYMEIKNKMKQ